MSVTSIIRGLINEIHVPTAPVVEAVVIKRNNRFHVVPRVWRDEDSGEVVAFNPLEDTIAANSAGLKSCDEALQLARKWANDRVEKLISPPEITAELTFKANGVTYVICRGYSSEDELQADIADLNNPPTDDDDAVLLHTAFTSAVMH